MKIIDSHVECFNIDLSLMYRVHYSTRLLKMNKAVKFVYN